MRAQCDDKEWGGGEGGRGGIFSRIFPQAEGRGYNKGVYPLPSARKSELRIGLSLCPHSSIWKLICKISIFLFFADKIVSKSKYSSLLPTLAGLRESIFKRT